MGPCGAFPSLCALGSHSPAWALTMHCLFSRVPSVTTTSADLPCSSVPSLAFYRWVSLSSLILQTFSFTQLTSCSSVLSDATSFSFTVSRRKSDDRFEGSCICITAAPSRQTPMAFSSNILVVVMRLFLCIPFFGSTQMVLFLRVHGFCGVFSSPFHPRPFLVTPCVLVA